MKKISLPTLKTYSNDDFLASVICEHTDVYELHTVSGILCPENFHLNNKLCGRSSLVVVDNNVYRFFKNEIDAKVLSLKANLICLECLEHTKTLEMVTKICNFAIDINLERQSVLIAIGGGVLTDLVRIASTLIRRGIKHICIPTSLIGQIDASVGIKAAVNFKDKKSYLGSYVSPEIVFIDPSLLSTLPKSHIINGISEALKIAIIKDKKLFDLIYKHHSELISSNFLEPYDIGLTIIREAAKYMVDELKCNIFEKKSYERLVDFGHTFSPLIESASNWKMHHGQAVSIDMALSSTIAFKLNLLSEIDLIYIISTLLSVGLPVVSSYATIELCEKAIQEASIHRGGTPNLVVPTSVGSATFIKDISVISNPVIEDSLKYLQKKIFD